MLQVLIFEKKCTLLNLSFGKSLNHGKNLLDLRGQNHCKNFGLVKHLAIYHGLKLPYLFFLFQRLLSLKNKLM